MLLELGPQLSQYLPDDGVLRSAENAKTVQLIGEDKQKLRFDQSVSATNRRCAATKKTIAQSN